MPTYDYICDACGHEWELFQKITDDAVKKCPECGKKKAVRQLPGQNVWRAPSKDLSVGVG